MRSSAATVASRSTKDGRTGTTMRSAALAATLAAVVGARPSRRCVEVPHVRTSAGAPLPLGTKPAWCCCQYHRRRGSAPLTPPGHRSVPGHRVERGTHIPSPCARQGVFGPDWRREHRDGRSRPIFGWFWARRRGDPPADDAPILGGLNDQSVARRLAAAARAVGIEGRITGHSGRVGLASELTARGATTTETMLAGGWKTARLVAH